MANYTYNENQIIQPGAAAQLTPVIPCTHRPQLVIYGPGTNQLTLRGLCGNPCANFARYRIVYNANIAVPEGGTAGEIQAALAIGGQIVPTSIGAATPTVAEAFWNVHGSATIDVPAGVDYTAAVVNASVSADPATTPAPAIEMRNLNLDVFRVA